jgi:hypothetical protein
MESAAFTPREILGLLAEEDRLKVVSALVLGASTSAEITATTGMTPRRSGRALARLATGGLVEGDAGGYRLRLEALREAARADTGADTPPDTGADAGADAGAEPGPPGPGGESARLLSRFVRGNRLTSIPVARGKRLVVLDHLAGLFEPGRRYTEAEVNQTLGAWHSDYASLRRYLVDEGFLRRADETDPSTGRSVKRYWRAGGSFEVD